MGYCILNSYDEWRCKRKLAISLSSKVGKDEQDEISRGFLCNFVKKRKKFALDSKVTSLISMELRKATPGRSIFLHCTHLYRFIQIYRWSKNSNKNAFLHFILTYIISFFGPKRRSQVMKEQVSHEVHQLLQKRHRLLMRSFLMRAFLPDGVFKLRERSKWTSHRFLVIPYVVYFTHCLLSMFKVRVSKSNRKLPQNKFRNLNKWSLQ